MRAPSVLYPCHHLIQEHVLLFSEEEALRGPFHLSPCQWTPFISAAAVSHRLAITIAITSRKTTAAAYLLMVCPCSPIGTVTITISSKCSCTFYECLRSRRIVPLWRLCRQIQVWKQW